MAWTLTPASELSVRQLLDEGEDLARQMRDDAEKLQEAARKMRADADHLVSLSLNVRDLLRRPPA
jgi:hypothetical protein